VRKKALILATVFALLLTSHFSPLTAAQRRGPSPYDLPGDCAIVAAEAASRLLATGAWVKVMHITFLAVDRRGVQIAGHAITAWQMPGGTHIFIYDEYILGGGSVELDTASHDCAEITRKFSRLTHTLIFESRFVG